MTRVSVIVVAAIAALSSPMMAITTLDLTTAGAQATGNADVGGSFIVQQINPQSTGTGVIDPFLRIQANTNEQGYNTSLSTPLDDKGGPFTRALLLSEIPTVTISGVVYRQFLLDINQNTGGTNEFLNLTQIQLFQVNADRNDGVVNPLSDSNSVSALTFPTGPAANQIFKMSNTAADAYNTILMDYSLNPGSGAGDMFLYVQNSLFSTALSNVIMYADFGRDPGGSGSNDGFEEWAVLKSSTTPCVGCTAVPEPTSVSLLTTLIGGLGWMTWKRRSALVKS
jgi:hypothetical protein